MTADPQNADGPDTREDLAWEARHCADRLEELTELAWEAADPGSKMRCVRELRLAARYARNGADQLDGRAS